MKLKKDWMIRIFLIPIIVTLWVMQILCLIPLCLIGWAMEFVCDDFYFIDFVFSLGIIADELAHIGNRSKE